MEFFATCGSGLEAVLGDELRACRVHGVRPLKGGVSFSGGLEDAYRALLWSRVASRVLLTLARVDARDADTLYEGVRSIEWEEHIAFDATFAIDARGTNDALRDTRFTALRVKDAIADRLRDLRGARPDVDAADPDIRVNVVVRRDKATVSLDLSGAPLERRGYRTNARVNAPALKENLAAALLLMAGWPEMAARGAGLVDLECGRGTLAVEAAMMAGDVAPGIMRSKWGFDAWPQHDATLWGRLVDEADSRAEAGASVRAPVLAASSLEAAREHVMALAKRAGVGTRIQTVASDDATKAMKRAKEWLAFCHIGNVAPAQLPAAYAHAAQALQAAVGADRALVLAPDEAVDAFIAAPVLESAQVRNGADLCEARVYDLTAARESHVVTVHGQQLHVADSGAQQFADRLTKVAKQRRKWAQEEGVSAYRVYDADLPDYNFAIDLIEGAGEDEGRRAVHIAEYAPPKNIDVAKSARRLASCMAVVPAALEVDPDMVFAKRRVRAKGGSQYAGEEGRAPEAHGKIVTSEGGLLFELDLAPYLDMGLFLDHRITRGLVRKLSADRRFLNLFAYTGTASVYAAAGGAFETTTVDLSNTYLQWAQRNMELNGFTGEKHKFVRADVLSWVSEMRHSKNRWDLIFVDPPTFSNSAKMGKRSWDVQRDHAELLIDVSRLLTRKGAAVFSCNLRNFELDRAVLEKAGVEVSDITAKTIPEDFSRNSKVHHCYILRRK